MANTISLSIDISVEDVGTLNDDTTFTSPVRASTNVFVQGFKVSSSSSQTAIVVTGNDEDPETDTSWDFDVATDGWYQFYYAAIPDYAGGTTYSQYDAVYDPSTSEVYVSVVDGNVGNATS